MTAFFQGTKLPIDGADGVKVFEIEGYEDAMQRAWSTDGADTERRYGNHPERMASLDESYMNEHDNSTGCAPKNAKHVGRLGGGQPQPVTVLSGATLSGYILPDIFLWEGVCASVNALKYAPLDCAAITRPDGYMMTWEGWIKVLEKLRDNIPGVRRASCLLRMPPRADAPGAGRRRREALVPVLTHR